MYDAKTSVLSIWQIAVNSAFSNPEGSSQVWHDMATICEKMARIISNSKCTKESENFELSQYVMNIRMEALKRGNLAYLDQLYAKDIGPKTLSASA